MIIDIDLVLSNTDTGLIISYKTGIYYKAQVGGLRCEQLKFEGILLPFGEFAQDFNDCDYGCCYLSEPEYKEQRQELAQDFDLLCINYFKGHMINLRFDFDRIDEVKEGWIPVLVSGEHCDITDDNNRIIEFENVKGIIHAGNCD
jgi:hypothetical protein